MKELGNGFRIDGRRLKLSGIGRVPVRWHRLLEGTVKTVRVVRKAGKWYATFACEVEASPLPLTGQEVGIDAGLSNLFTLATGEGVKVVDNPRWYRRSQWQIRRLQRRVARREKGGSNRKKAVLDLARYSERVANQRKDFLGKVVHDVVARFDRIAVEDLSVSRMVYGNLAKSILDAGWGFFRQRLLSKAESAGRTVVPVDPAYTTQSCCQCGQRQALSLSQRWYSCPCGNSRDRDANAALNILAAGRAVWASSPATAGLAQEAAGL
jgi:putative transposase